MFASIVQSLLVKHLGKYVDGIRNNMEIGLIDGQVTIENVSLKSSFINELNLPVSLKFSHIDKIHISIPWTSLKEKSTQVTVQGIYMLLQANYDDEIEEQIDPQERLKAMIERIKLEVKRKWEEKQAKPETLAEKSLIRIVDNLNLSINSIHIRLQSFIRNWDYSCGAILDNINCFTVDDFQQKSFYTRSFSHKEANKIMRKVLNIGRLDIYLNSDEEVFMIANVSQGPAFIKRMMNHPFPVREEKASVRKKPNTQEDLKSYPPYELRLLTKLSVSVSASQKFATDLRYIVELGVVVDGVDLKVGERQVSQLLFCVQHLYEYGLNLTKNGRKNYNFNRQVEEFFRATIKKVAGEEKLTTLQSKQMMGVVAECPMSLLEGICDEIIQQFRFAKEVKKISKVSNAEKSRKMMSELLEKKEKEEAMEGAEIFQNVLVEVMLPRLRLILDDQNTVILELGLQAISVKVHLPLQGAAVVSLNCSSLGLKTLDRCISSAASSPMDFLRLDIEFQKTLRLLKVSISKQRIDLSESILVSMLKWMRHVRIRTPLVNFIDQLMNYSVDITKMLMSGLIAENRQVSIEVDVPKINLQLDSKDALEIDLGHISGLNPTEASFRLTYTQPIRIVLNGSSVLLMKEGNSITMHEQSKDECFQRIHFNFLDLKIEYIREVLQFLGRNRDCLLRRTNESLKMSGDEDEQLDGQFYLNKLKKKQVMFLTRNKLLFLPSQQTVSLVRTRVYKMTQSDRFFILLKEEVDKEVNIIETSSRKAMDTIGLKLREYTHQICTPNQWEKYYQQAYPETVNSLESLSNNHDANPVLMALQVSLKKLALHFDSETHLDILNSVIGIAYNQFSTKADFHFSTVNLLMNDERVVYDASFKASYEYLRHMLITIGVDRLYYCINRFATFSKFINLASQYSLLTSPLIKPLQGLSQGQLEEDESRLNLSTQKQSHPQLFLLEKQLLLQTEHIQGCVLGYRNNLDFISLQISMFRNDPIPTFISELRGITLFSMLNLPLVSARISSKEFWVQMSEVRVLANSQIILYELVKGEGRLVLSSALQALKDRNEMKASLSHAAQESKIARRIAITVRRMLLDVMVTKNLSVSVQVGQVRWADGVGVWSQASLWLNGDCLSLSEINGQVSLTQQGYHLEISNLRLRLLGSDAFQVIRQITKMSNFFRDNNFNIEEIYEEEVKGIVQVNEVQRTKLHSIFLESVQIIYKSPILTLDLRVPPSRINTQQTEHNFSMELWHFNRQFTLYEPLLEPLSVRISLKPGEHQVFIEDVKLVITQELMRDLVAEFSQIQEILQATQSMFEKTSPQQIEKQKQIMQNEQFGSIVDAQFAHDFDVSSVLQITNHLQCGLLVEVSSGHIAKQVLHFEGASTKTAHIPQKVICVEDHEIVERCRKVHFKVSLLSLTYTMHALTFSCELFDSDRLYLKPALLVDDSGDDLSAVLALDIKHREGVFQMSIQGQMSLANLASIPIYVRSSSLAAITRHTLAPHSTLQLPWLLTRLVFGLAYDSCVVQLALGQQNCESLELNIQEKDSKAFTPMLIKKERLSATDTDRKAYKYTLLMRFIVMNHLQIPLTVNGQQFDPGHEADLMSMLGQDSLSLGLGDGTLHQVGIPQSDGVAQLKLKGDNFVALRVHTRNNELGQTVIHLSAEMELSIHLPHGHEPSLTTNIYDNNFRIHKRVCNDYHDHVHPSTVMRDRFVLNSYYFLLGRQERYIRMHIKGASSNQIILQASDFEGDLSLSPLDMPPMVYSVAYRQAVTVFNAKQNDQLECHAVQILPKYYISNASSEELKVDGVSVVAKGERIALGCNKNNTFAVSGVNEFQFVPCNLDDTLNLLFVRNVPESTGGRMYFDAKDVKIVAVHAADGEFNTVCYEISDWADWTAFRNQLTSVVVVRTAISDQITTTTRIQPGATRQLAGGLSQVVDFAIETADGQLVLGEFPWNQRLNHSIFVEELNGKQIQLRQHRMARGRFAVITTHQPGKKINVEKAQTMVGLVVRHLHLSIVLKEEKRREVWRLDADQFKLLNLNYRQGLYFLDIQLQQLRVTFKRNQAILGKDLQLYLHGHRREFIEKIVVKTTSPLTIAVTDQLILSVLVVLDSFKEKNKQVSPLKEAVAEPTYHVNCLEVSALELRLSARKTMVGLSKDKLKLLSQVGLHFVEVDRAAIHLPAVDIDEPLKQKHIDAITQKCVLQICLGMFSGLNIIGNPRQFVQEYRAGRSRGGALSFVGGIVAGTTSSVSKIVGTLGNGISELTFDEDYQQQRLDSQRVRANSFGDGLKQGLQMIANSFKSGFVGLIQRPIQAQKKDGGMGFLKGSLQGITGLLTKPATGIIDAASKTIEGINYSTTYLENRGVEEDGLSRPLYHRLRVVRKRRRQDEVASQAMSNWFHREQLDLIGTYLLEDEEGESGMEMLVITCSELILVNMKNKIIIFTLPLDSLIATGKFKEGVVLYLEESDENDIVFHLRKDELAKDSLYMTLKTIIGCYRQNPN